MSASLHLYTSPTPNGYKASVCLEEMELAYECHAIDLRAEEQKKPDFLALNPNGRIPVLVDHDHTTADGKPLNIFESGALMIHLAEKTGKFLPTAAAPRAKVLSWLMFQMGGIGPMMGQANVFYRYFPEKLQPAIDRYQNEGRRLFEVLDGHLKHHEWLGDEFSIADMANWCWTRTANWSGVKHEDLEHMTRWHKAMEARPGCQRGVKVPVDIAELMRQREEQPEDFAREAAKMVQR